MNHLVSAAARGPVKQQHSAQRRVPLAARAAAQHAGRAPAVLGRVTATSVTVPSASAFQSAL
ncbi:hypothetical protein ACFYZ9_38490 [Streptomyces sp. NPDC001691]|uniref:hypothetical protein n=1 Tax=Streptomyces sp. NPDC001691 TaxID=3364600 RepID=UPI0036C69643